MEHLSLQGYSDANYAGDIDERKSTSAYIFTMGRTPVSWSSKKQNVTFRSSCELEYRALAKTTCEAIWLRRLIRELGFGDKKPTMIWCDNQSSIKIARNPMFHDRTKHFEIDLHFTKQKVEDKTITVVFISTTDQPADILTKPPDRQKFEKQRESLYIKSIEEIKQHEHATHRKET